MKYDKGTQAAIVKSFTDVGDALQQILAASRLHDWDARQRASEALGTAAGDIYRLLTQEEAHPVGG